MWPIWAELRCVMHRLQHVCSSLLPDNVWAIRPKRTLYILDAHHCVMLRYEMRGNVQMATHPRLMEGAPLAHPCNNAATSLHTAHIQQQSAAHVQQLSFMMQQTLSALVNRGRDSLAASVHAAPFVPRQHVRRQHMPPAVSVDEDQTSQASSDGSISCHYDDQSRQLVDSMMHSLLDD